MPNLGVILANTSHRNNHYVCLAVPVGMDSLGRIRSGYNSENWQPLHVDTNIVYRLEEQRFPGLREDHCEPSLSICPEYLAVHRLTHRTQALTALPSSEIDAHRELYNLIEDLDFLSDDLSPVPDQFIETLLEMATTAKEESTGVPTSFLSCIEPTSDTMDCDDVFLFGATDDGNIQSFTVPRSHSSCCTSKPRRKSSTYQASRTLHSNADITSKPQKKRRYSSVCQELSDVACGCVKRRKLSSYNNGNVHDRTECSDFAVSSTLVSPLSVFSQSFAGHSPLRQW